MRTSQIPQYIDAHSSRTPEIQPQTVFRQGRTAVEPRTGLPPAYRPHWIQVKLHSLDKERRNTLLKKAKEVKYFYLDFLVAIKETNRSAALPGSKKQLISSRIKESIQFEGSTELIELRRSLTQKLASLKKRRAKLDLKSLNPMVRLICYPKRKLLDKKLHTYEGVVRDLVRITQKLQIAVRDARTVSNGQNQN